MIKKIILFHLFGAASSTCLNDPTFEVTSHVDRGSPLKNCRQIRIKQSRRENLCPMRSVNEACPHTCGKCCEDDDSYFFKLQTSDKMVDCEWISMNSKKKEKRILRYCTKNNSKGKLYAWGNRTVRDGCPKSCDFCFNDDKAITVAPTSDPSQFPTSYPTLSSFPSDQPTRPPSPMPSPFPTLKPSNMPSTLPSQIPSTKPSYTPSSFPSDQPSLLPSNTPSYQPSLAPSIIPSYQPSHVPSDRPSEIPSRKPSDSPSLAPSDDPSSYPSSAPSDSPSMMPSSDPSDTPTTNPTQSIKPSSTPTAIPTDYIDSPSGVPSSAPTLCDDDPSFKFTLDNDSTKERQCSWLLQHKNLSIDKKRTDNYCVRQEINRSCCTSCYLPEKVQSSFLKLSLSGTCECTNEFTEALNEAVDVSSFEIETFLALDCAPKCAENRQDVVAVIRQDCDGDCQRTQNDYESLFKTDEELLIIVRDAANEVISILFPTGVDIGYEEILENLTAQPSSTKTTSPSKSPTPKPTRPPTRKPTKAPSSKPTALPIQFYPSSSPTITTSPFPEKDITQSSHKPSDKPSQSPSKKNSTSPSHQPSDDPSQSPTDKPSVMESNQPSIPPSDEPTLTPSIHPSRSPSAEPSSAPTVCQEPLLVNTVCGSVGGCGSKSIEAVAGTFKHAVRCCSDTALGETWIQNYSNVNCSSVWSQSEISGLCHNAETYCGAESICEEAGARLCTTDELLNDCTNGAGCNHDNRMCWASL